MNDINKWTEQDFRNLPHISECKDIDIEDLEFDSLVILPQPLLLWEVLKFHIILWLKTKIKWFDSYYLPSGMHDSGYRCMDFAAIKGDKPICRLSGSSDVIHFNGIGGYGKDWLKKYGTIPDKIEPPEWNIDCLRTSGLLRIFGGKLSCGYPLSSFEIYTEKQNG